MNESDALKLENQLCFPLYALSREIIKTYTPILKQFDLTYTQYIVMLVMWEKETIAFKELSTTLHLDSGTLTPVVKTLIKKGWITKKRSDQDDRNVEVTITKTGMDMKGEAVAIPRQIFGMLKQDTSSMIELKRLLDESLKLFDVPVTKEK